MTYAVRHRGPFQQAGLNSGERKKHFHHYHFRCVLHTNLRLIIQSMVTVESKDAPKKGENRQDKLLMCVFEISVCPGMTISTICGLPAMTYLQYTYVER